jgi:hypothetical protein
MAQPPPGQGKGGQGGSSPSGQPAKSTGGAAPAPRTATSGAVPAAGAPPRTATSGAVPAAGAPPRTATGTGIPRTSTSSGIPAADGGVRRSPTLSSLPNVRAGITAFETSRVDSKSYNKKIGLSAFDGTEERTQVDALLGASGPPVLAAEENTSVGRTFDGQTAPPELTNRDLWRAINPPLQSREGRRSADLYKQVLNQFAVGTNPRYEPDAPDKPRAHIFVWDVTRAMNAEIPHFAGAREQTLAQTCDWMRREGTMRGWRRADMAAAIQAANQGMPVVAMPKDQTIRLMAMVRPGDPDVDGRPRFAGATLERGNDMGCKDTFGVMALEYFVHP